VRSGVSRAASARRLLLATPLVFLLLTGCDTDSYPADLKYPPRNEVILSGFAEKDLGVYPDPPGTLDIAMQRETDKAVLAKAGMLHPSEVAGPERSEIMAALENHFGTPAQPKLDLRLKEKEASLVFSDDAKVEAEKTLVSIIPVEAGGSRDAELATGSKLYRRHCLQCHGITGNGRGPTGPWLSPRPRDYRKGVFKFVAPKGEVSGGKNAVVTMYRPKRDDLLRILHNGVDGTSMPSFGLLEEKELNQIVSYVIHLAIRGEVEDTVLKGKLQKDPEKLNDKNDSDTITPKNIPAYTLAAFRDSLLDKGKWGKASAASFYEPATPSPRESPASKVAAITHGHQLFVDDAQGGCLKCHIDYGRNALYRYDAWGTEVRPRDLTLGTYRGGRRPIDLFSRIRGGISPSTMPAADPKLSDQDLWDIIEFVQAVPYPKMLPDKVRAAVYPTLKIEKE
jgi:mono/diheme cytochrome c family protein